MSDAALDDDDEESGGEALLSDGRDLPIWKRKKMLFIAGGVLAALLLIGAGLYFTGVLGKLFGAGHSAEQAAEAPPAPAKDMVFYDMPDLLVNLNSVGKKSNFLKISISLELENKADMARLQSVMPRIIDNFQTYLRELRLEDLKGSAGLYRLREELLLRVNAAVAPAVVNDVLFREMLVQ